MIRLSPLAFQKIITAVNFNAWEVGFYGITEPDDVTAIVDVFMPEQQCNAGRNEFDEQSVSEYVAGYLKTGYHMRQLTTVWIHTHPGSGMPTPSSFTGGAQVGDVQMFDRMMKHGGQVGIMLIATKDSMKAWLRVKPVAGLKRSLETEEKVEIDWSMDCVNRFSYKRWKKRHSKVVTFLAPPVVTHAGSYGYGVGGHNVNHIPASPINEQCTECRVFKSKAGVVKRKCINAGCSNETKAICWECHIGNDRLCYSCFLASLEADSKEQEDKESVAIVDADGRVLDREDPTCEYDCVRCYLNACSARMEEYDPAVDCIGECDTCTEPWCYSRDATPAHMNCHGGCTMCTLNKTCEYCIDLDEIEAEGTTDGQEQGN
jgi:hypothetical protein